MSKCDSCSIKKCYYEYDSDECRHATEICSFCTNHCVDDTIYERDPDGWDSYIPIRNIKYCPLCGAELTD